MSQARLECSAVPLHEDAVIIGTQPPGKAGRGGKAQAAPHALIVLAQGDALPEALPGGAQLGAVLQRRAMKLGELAKTPVALDLPGGARCAYVMVDPAKDRFTQLTTLRKAAILLLDETPAAVHLAVYGAGDEALARQLAREALYVLWLNGAALPTRKQKPAQPLQRIVLHAGGKPAEFAEVAALAAANTLARELTALPPNELTPGHYRARIRALAKAQGWQIEEYDFKKLRKLGAGAFCAVAQGSLEQDAAIVRLSYRPKNAQRRVALVGKGICFDTGGHNLKPAKYMAGMHEDMNGSAVALALLQAAQALRLPLAVDAWLAIAQNHVSAAAYKQNDIVTALDGTHIEIVHTDAEGRLVLADTLTLATRAAKNGGKTTGKKEARPELVIDFATLTGSMIGALGNRYVGVFASSDELGALAVGAGRQSGERVCVFPMDEDYEAALDSKVADIKQCTLEGEADHILAARFLKRFTHDLPWLHVDLAAANCSGGLGAVASDITGFGVAWGAALLAQWSAG